MVARTSCAVAYGKNWTECLNPRDLSTFFRSDRSPRSNSLAEETAAFPTRGGSSADWKD
jgi:hypothetical protein